MFKEIAALAQPGALHLIIVKEGDKLGVTLNRKPGKDCTALSIHAKGSPEELDAEFVLAIAEGLAMHDAPDETKSVAEQVKGQLAAPEVVEPVVKEMGTPQAAAAKSTGRKKRTPKAKAEPKAPKKARRPRVSKAPSAPPPEAPKTRRKRKASPEPSRFTTDLAKIVVAAIDNTKGAVESAQRNLDSVQDEVDASLAKLKTLGDAVEAAAPAGSPPSTTVRIENPGAARGGGWSGGDDGAAPVRDTKTPDLFS